MSDDAAIAIALFLVFAPPVILAIMAMVAMARRKPVGDD